MTQDVLTLARQVISIEVEGLVRMSERLDAAIAAAVSEMLACKGRVIVIGMGKSGIIGRKMAATLG